jgi:hypothetical protein
MLVRTKPGAENTTWMPKGLQAAHPYSAQMGLGMARADSFTLHALAACDIDGKTVWPRNLVTFWHCPRWAFRQGHAGVPSLELQAQGV